MFLQIVTFSGNGCHSFTPRTEMHIDIRSLRDQIEVFKVLNGYENIDRNIFSYLRKILEVEDTR